MNCIMKSKDLKHLTIIELRRLAKRFRVSPKRTMTKEQLIKSIVRANRSKAISETLKKRRKAQAIPKTEKPAVEEHLPIYKGINKIVLMPRDPWWVFAYWEVDKSIVSNYDLTLKLYRQHERLYAIINVGKANNWYLNLPEPSDTVRAELGYFRQDAGFVIIATSNIIKTPRAWPSDISYTGNKEPLTTQNINPFMDAYKSYEQANPYIRENITSRKW